MDKLKVLSLNGWLNLGVNSCFSFTCLKQGNGFLVTPIKLQEVAGQILSKLATLCCFTITNHFQVCGFTEKPQFHR